MNIDDIKDFYKKKDLPFDYGKYMIYPEIQDLFKNFLSVKKVEFNRKENEKYWGKAYEEKNYQKKIKLLIKGAKKGSPGCAQELGVMYYLGDGVAKDISKAEKYLKLAAQCGFLEAMRDLGLLYIYISDDYTNRLQEGMDWLCKAAGEGCESAFIKIRDLSLENVVIKFYFEARLSLYFTEICDIHDRTSIDDRILGMFFYTGLCCFKNLDLAKKYWVEGEKKGDSHCRFCQEYFLK